MKAYPEYKSYGIDWLGEIPSHWKVMSGKWSVDFTYGFPADSKLFSIEKKGLPLIRIRDIYSTDTEVYYEGDDYPYDSIIIPGDILIGMDGDFNVAKWNGPKAILNQRVCKYNNSDAVSKDYMFYLLPLILDKINATKYATTVKHLSAADLSEMRITVPPVEEQVVIAAYLDEVTGRVDALIAKKQKLVVDLRSYRTSLITETVTHGLNHGATLRPSGIDWLGDIPEHWAVSPLKYLISEPLMYGANESPEDDLNINNPRYIRITDITDNGSLREETYRTLEYYKALPYLLKAGDILFARSGATVGKTYRFVESYPCCFAGYLIKATFAEKLNSKFFQYYTTSLCYLNWKNSIFDKSTIQNISAEKYNLLSVPVPPLAEQQAIAEFLNEKTDKIDTLICELEKQLEELVEYKKAIISEAVTGKVDVRDWKPQN